MKSFLLIPFLFAHCLSSAQQIKPINGKVQKATVYLQGAHLYYSESVNLLPGNNDFIFENISPYILESSIQASSRNGVVMDMKSQTIYQQKVKIIKHYDHELMQVKDSIEDLYYDLKAVENKLKVLSTEKNMLMSNRIIKGEPLRDSLALLKDGMLFLKEKLSDIYDQELKLERIKNRLEKKNKILNERLNAIYLLQNGGNESNVPAASPIHQVIVTIYSESAMPSQINFNYYIQNASWLPAYDLQASSVASSFQLKYFANVTQTSGLDWKNATLTLSTSNPTESNIKPTLSPWYLCFITYYKNLNSPSAPSANSGMRLSKESLSLQDKGDNQIDDAKAEEKRMTDYINIAENMIRTESEIKLSYTVNSDGKPHKVLINQKEVAMTLQYDAVPKACTDAFLMARITGWEEMNIIPGNARLYFDGGYVGEMFLDASSVTDTLNVNLGRDKSIVLSRKKIKEKFKVKTLGIEKTETRTIELVVRNTKNISIELLLEDQIPVVQGTSEIKVQLVSGANAELEESSGKLSWKLKLNAKETKKIQFTYQVTYPGNKPIAGL